MGCKHHYVYTQGHFYCTKCGHRHYGSGTSRRSSRSRGSKAGKFIGILLVIVFGLVAVPIGMNYFGIPISLDILQPTIPAGRNLEITLGEGLDAVEEEQKPQEQNLEVVPSKTETQDKKMEQPVKPSEPKLVPIPIPKPEPTPTPKPQITQAELLKFAVEQINKDRAEQGLSPVLLSNNQAAQIHAEDILKTKTISHWMTNGEKPYMTYTIFGGTGDVSQNISFSGYDDIEQCKRPYVICEKIEPFDAIKKAEYGMMYNDAYSNWGHRDNIIRPSHTHVSIGIAYDDYTFVFVQNFEDNYLDGSIQYSNNLVQINGNLREGKVLNIGIFYDRLPTPSLYELHKDDSFYELGELVAIVEHPLPPNTYYDQPSDYQLIVANSWQENGQNLSISFDTSKVFSHSGVYTVGIWLENKGEAFLISSYSIVIN